MSLNPGTQLGPYEIVAPLGAGGMGEVDSSRDTRLGRDVALKLLPDSASRARSAQEARLLAALNHPTIPMRTLPISTRQPTLSSTLRRRIQPK
jgi:serine/threonine protein kinase